MTVNVGKIDRILRAVIGAFLLLMALAAGWGWIAGIVGAVLLATSAMRFCPAYRLLGMNTCGM